jgi:hypothetical protein
VDQAVNIDAPLSRDLLTQAALLVRSVYRGNRELPTLRRISNQSDWLSLEQTAYLENDPDAIAVTFGDLEAKTFDIWLSPALQGFHTGFAVDTLLHELTHGYVSCYNHSSQFRRFLARLLCHYQWNVQDDFDSVKWVTALVTRYNRFEFENRAWEIDCLIRAAEQEKDHVSLRFKELTNAQGLVSV